MSEILMTEEQDHKLGEALAQRYGGSFILEMALSWLGIWGDQRATVETAIPEIAKAVNALATKQDQQLINDIAALYAQLQRYIPQIVDVYNRAQPAIALIQQEYPKIAPAIQILTNALAAKAK